MNSECWSPLVTGPDAERVRDVARRIADDVAACSEDADVSWGRGMAGIALALAYSARCFPEEGYDDRCVALLDRAIGIVGSVPAAMVPYDLCLGLGGLAWTIEHLGGWFLEGGDIDTELDAAIQESLRTDGPARLPFDLLNGVVGYGVLGSERLLKRGDRTLLEASIACLAGKARSEPEGTTWATVPRDLSPEGRAKYPRGVFDLGLAHGLPGAIALLGVGAAAGVEGARSLLDDGMRWLSARQVGGAARGELRFPALLDLDRSFWTSRGDSRLGWCYGDLGVACALLFAARAVGEPEWETAAIDLALNAAHVPDAHSGVMDAAICHGASGVSHMFNRLFQATGREELRTAARYWLDRTLAMRTADAPMGGYLVQLRKPDSGPYWGPSPSFLEGSAGVLLVLLAAVTDFEPAWDRSLLLSYPMGSIVPSTGKARYE